MHNVWPHFKSKSPYTFVLQGFTSKSAWKVRFKSIPAGYMGSPDDIVSAVRWLLSEEARYVNGANIQISGTWGI